MLIICSKNLKKTTLKIFIRNSEALPSILELANMINWNNNINQADNVLSLFDTS